MPTTLSNTERPIARKLLEAVRSLHLSRATAGVEVAFPAGTSQLFFRGGELFLPADGDLAREYAAGGLARVLAIMETWTPANVRAIDPPSGDARLAGPLPTARWIMESFVRGRNEDELLELLGGERARLVARGGAASAVGSSLDSEDAYLLSRLERPTLVGDVLHQGMDRRSTRVRLCRLLAIELVATADPQTYAGSDASPFSPAVLERFLERVAADLADLPIHLVPAAHRVRVAQLLAQCGGMTHYELLGVAADAAEDQIHRAFHDLARLVHPAHATALQLGGREGALLLLFERATRAYLTLNEPRRRAAYDAEMGLGSTIPDEGARGEERRAQARSAFERARDLAAAEDFHFAIELLRQAVVLDPQADYYHLLGLCQLRNPNWFRMALDSARAGLRLKPSDVGLHILCGQALEKAGDLDAAAEEFLWVCDRDPGQALAAEGLGRIATACGVQVEPYLRKLRAASRPR